MILYQNHSLFQQYMPLNMYDPESSSKRTIPMSAWTQVLSDTSDPYEFVECFVAQVFEQLGSEAMENRMTESMNSENME